ncbi:MAG: SGNH/GDSL hydrolase family protein [Hyphomicrobiaceae bacterium]
MDNMVRLGATGLLAVLSLAGVAGRASAQTVGLTLAPSGTCSAPDAAIAAPAPLPRFARLVGTHRKIRVLAIGSSSTVGVGASSPRQRYPDQLEQILENAVQGLDVEIVNGGVSGEMARTTAERLKQEVARLDPDLVLWQVGTNDALARVPIEDFAATLTATLRWLKEREKDVALVGLQYTVRLSKDDHYKAIKETLRRIAAQEKILLVHRYEAMEFIAAAAKKDNELLANDAFHLNDLGYRCMAEHIARAIALSALAQPPSR